MPVSLSPSPALRLILRLQSSVTPVPYNKRPLDSQDVHQQPRMIQFDQSLEAVSVLSCAVVQNEPYTLTNTSSAVTSAPNSQAERFGEMETVTPDSQARRFSDLETVAPDTQARRFRELETVAPNSQARRFSDMETVCPTAEIEEQAPITPNRSQPPARRLPQVGGAILIDEEDATTAEEVRITEACEMSHVFSFLSQLSVKMLRVILKNWKLRQNGRKEILVAKVMLHLQLSMLPGRSLTEMFSGQAETRRYQSWLRSKLLRDESFPVSIYRIPAEDLLTRLLPDNEASEYRRRKISIERARSGSPSVPDEPTVSTTFNQVIPQAEEQNESNNEVLDLTDNHQFGINEFARLLIILRNDENARAAAAPLGQVLSRSQLDTGVTKADFWTIVESRFNDSTQRRFLNMTGAVDGVDSRLPPSAHRSASFLKDKLNNTKANFTQYVTRWSASGQNDPDRFRSFLPKVANGELSALGKRMMVMFVCTRKGTPHEEEQFSNLCCKIIPGSEGRDEGSRCEGSAADGRSDRQSCRKRTSSEAEGISGIAGTSSKIATSYENSKTDKHPSQSEKQLKDYSCRLKKIKILEDVVKKLAVHPAAESHDSAGNNTEQRDRTLLLALRKLQRDVSKYLLSDEELEG